MDENYKFYIGILLIAIGVGYAFWNLNKEDYDSNDWLKEVDSTNSWGIVFFLIVIGIVMLF
jgi:hypothetical protein